METRTFQLAGGRRVKLTPEESKLVYDELWTISGFIKGAVSTAALIEAARRSAHLMRPAITLTDVQSAAFSVALAGIRH